MVINIRIEIIWPHRGQPSVFDFLHPQGGGICAVAIRIQLSVSTRLVMSIFIRERLFICSVLCHYGSSLTQLSIKLRSLRLVISSGIPGHSCVFAVSRRMGVASGICNPLTCCKCSAASQPHEAAFLLLVTIYLMCPAGIVSSAASQ